MDDEKGPAVLPLLLLLLPLAPLPVVLLLVVEMAAVAVGAAPLMAEDVTVGWLVDECVAVGGDGDSGWLTPLAPLAVTEDEAGAVREAVRAGGEAGSGGRGGGGGRSEWVGEEEVEGGEDEDEGGGDVEGAHEIAAALPSAADVAEDED